MKNEIILPTNCNYVGKYSNGIVPFRHDIYWYCLRKNKSSKARMRK